jgi:hypothetical protein
LILTTFKYSGSAAQNSLISFANDENDKSEIIKIIDLICTSFSVNPNALLTGKLGAQRVIFPSAATCYASLSQDL